MTETTTESADDTEIEAEPDGDAEADAATADAETKTETTTESDAEPDVDTGVEAEASDDSSVASSSDSSTPQAFSAIIEAQRLDKTIETLSVIVDESRIHLNELGLRLAAVDPANVAMDETNVTENAFESYQSDGGVLGVDLSKLADVVSMADADDLVQMSLDPKTRKLVIRIDDLEYTLALIDPDSIRQEPDIPDLDLPARVVLEGRDLDRAIRAADMVSDHVELAVDEDEEVFLVTASGDTDGVDLELERDDLIELEAAPAGSLFSLDYLKDLNKAIPKDAEIEIRLGEDFPTMIEYSYADGAANVTQMLAPRMESD